MFAYDHDRWRLATARAASLTGCSIIGGAFYPETGPFPQAYRGSYYFTDFCNKVIHRLDLANGNAAYTFGTVTGSQVVA